MACNIYRIGLFFDRKKISGLLLLSLLALSLTGCKEDSEAIQNINSKEQTKEIYVDFKRWQEGRLCGDIAFRCLPENRDPSWQEIPLKDGLDTFELTPEVEDRFDRIVKEWHRRYDEYHSKPHPKGEKKPMLISQLDKEFFDKVKERRFLERMERSLEEEFPGFWRDTPKEVRYRWIRLAMNKAKRFGYDPKQNQPMVELCARIGLDFDKDPKWDYITKFISKKRVNVVLASRYLDFTVFKKDIDRAGDQITDWSLRGCFPDIPYPKRPIPRLNDY